MADGIPDAWVTAGIQGVIALHKRKRDMPWTCPSGEDVAAVAAAVLPLERERIAADLRRLARGAVPGVERDTYLAAAQVALHGAGEGQERSDEKEAGRG